MPIYTVNVQCNLIHVYLEVSPIVFSGAYALATMFYNGSFQSV